MEIERKFLITTLPENLESYPYHTLEQAYLCTDPVVRVRRSDDEYLLTYKSRGLMSREEYNLPLNAESYNHLKAKADGNIIRWNRDSPLNLTFLNRLSGGWFSLKWNFPPKKKPMPFFRPTGSEKRSPGLQSITTVRSARKNYNPLFCHRTATNFSKHATFSSIAYIRDRKLV